MLTDYEPLVAITKNTKHELFVGRRGAQKVFIKKYLIRPDREETDRFKMMTEIACYDHLTESLELPRPIASDEHEGYLVLPFIEYEDIVMSTAAIDAALQLHDRLTKLDASFLKPIGWDYYTGYILDHLSFLEDKMNVAEMDCERIKAIFLDHKEVILKQVRCFSHGDFHFDNMKWHNGELVVMDFENTRQDTVYYDFASMYQSFFHVGNGLDFIDYYHGKLTSRPDFDEKMFHLMLVRRCIAVMLYLHDKKDAQARTQTLAALNRALQFLDTN